MSGSVARPQVVAQPKAGQPGLGGVLSGEGTDGLAHTLVGKAGFVVDLIQRQRAHQQVKVAVDEAGHQRAARAIDLAGVWTQPLLRPRVAADKHNAVALDGDRTGSGLVHIRGEDLRTGDQ